MLRRPVETAELQRPFIAYVALAGEGDRLVQSIRARVDPVQDPKSHPIGTNSLDSISQLAGVLWQIPRYEQCRYHHREIDPIIVITGCTPCASDHGIETRGEQHGDIIEKVLDRNGAADANREVLKKIPCCAAR